MFAVEAATLTSVGALLVSALVGVSALYKGRTEKDSDDRSQDREDRRELRQNVADCEQKCAAVAQELARTKRDLDATKEELAYAQRRIATLEGANEALKSLHRRPEPPS